MNTKSNSIISTEPIIGSKKIYIQGSTPDIQVPMREIKLSKTNTDDIDKFVIYDTSGVYTDENYKIEIEKGLPRIREKWITDRNDIEQLSDFSSEYAHTR